MSNKWEKLANDLVDVEESGGFINIKSGIYPAIIKAVEDVEAKDYLKINFDFVGGEYDNHFSELHKTKGPDWDFNGQFIRSYKDSALSFFKSFITSVEKSNDGYNFAKEKGKPSSLVGKRIVVIFADTEVPVPDTTNNNKPKVYPKFYGVRSMEALRDGTIKLPEAVQKLKGEYDLERYAEALATLNAEAPTTKPPLVSADDLPF